MAETKLDYPQMFEYSWVQDLDRVRQESKFINHVRKGNSTPPAPVSQVLEIMDEILSRPEVVTAYQEQP